MTDMLSLFESAPAENRPVAVVRPSPSICCGRAFETWPAFLGHLGASHAVVR